MEMKFKRLHPNTNTNTIHFSRCDNVFAKKQCQKAEQAESELAREGRRRERKKKKSKIKNNSYVQFLNV